MSEEKKGLGIFVNKRADKAAAAAAPAAPGKKKDVQKRWLYVGVGFVGLIILSTTLFSDNSKKPRTAPTKDAGGVVSVNPPKADKAAFESQYAQDAASLRGMVEDLKKENERRSQEVADLKAAMAKGPTGAASTGATPAPSNLPPGIVPPPAGLGNTGGIGQTVPPVVAPPAPPVPPTRASGDAGAPPRLSDVPAVNVPPAPSQGGEPMVFDAPGKASSNGQSLDPANPPSVLGGSGSGVRSKVDYRKNPNAGMLPAGAFAPVSLLNGLDAGTSATTQSNPMPVLMNVTDQATLPGAARYRLKNCFVLGTGYGDMSSERVYIRFSRLSCVDKADKLVLSQEVSGYVVDSDGKLGMRGMLVDRQGAKLAKALLAGFAQGLTGALGQAQSSVTSNLTNGTSTSTLNGGAALRAAGLSGAQSATNQLAEFYLKEAQAMFPVITVDAGRTATIVFSGSTTLNWGQGEGVYQANVTPDKSSN